MIKDQIRFRPIKIHTLRKEILLREKKKENFTNHIKKLREEDSIIRDQYNGHIN